MMKTHSFSHKIYNTFRRLWVLCCCFTVGKAKTKKTIKAGTRYILETDNKGHNVSIFLPLARLPLKKCFSNMRMKMMS